MTKFIKTVPIEAEQFDGSEDMINKYHVRCDTEYMLSDDPLEYQTAPYQMETLEGWSNIDIGDWIATGAHGEHYPIADEIFKQTYQELPVIPQTIARAMTAYRHVYGDDKGLSILLADWQRVWALGVLPELTNVPQLILESYRDKAATVARAWLDGYEIDNKS